MLINVNIALSEAGKQRLPPQLVQFGSEGLVLVELQGALEVEGNKDGQLVGVLRVDETTNKPTMMIGHHLLEGKLVNLSKPLAVLHRGSSQSEEANMDVDDESEASGKTEGVSWDIVAIVKRKMVFSRRPMPIVGKPASGAAPLSRIGSRA